MGVISTSTIVHEVRARLRVSCDQYVIADTISYLSARRKPCNERAIAQQLGMSENDVKIICIWLVGYEIIVWKGLAYSCTTKWYSAFGDDSLFDNPLPRNAIPGPDYVPGFWQIYKRQGSSKPETLANWRKVTKTVRPEDLIEAAKNYLAAQSDITYVMHSQRFLDPNKKRYESWLPQEPVTQGFGMPEVQKDMSTYI